MPDITSVLPEIIVGFILGGFAWAFKGWSNTIERATEKIINRLEILATTFNDHRLETEKRVTKVEVQINNLYHKIEDRCDPSKDKTNNT